MLSPSRPLGPSWAAMGLLCALAFAGPGLAEGMEVEARLQAALQAESNLDYDVALIELQQVIADGRATDAQLMKAHYRAGIICRVLDKNVEAEQHLKAALRKNPNLLPPPGASPKIVSFFNTVRESVQAEIELNARIERAKLDREAAEEERAEAARLREQAPEPALPADDEAGGLSVGTSLVVGGGFATAISAVFALSGVGGATLMLYTVVGDASQPADLRHAVRQGVIVLLGGSALLAAASVVAGGVALTGLFVE
jgi:tetratricopeptide (TPR) repeat protein